MNAQGIPGRAPSLHGVGALAADFYLETGRMPLPSPRAQPMPTRPAFSQAKIQTLIDYVASFGGPAIPTVHPQQGSLSKGQSLFALDCAGCHTIQGSGGIVTGAVVPSLNVATPQADRRGDADRAVRDAALRSRGALRSRHRLDRALRAQHPGARMTAAAGVSGGSARSPRAWSRGCSRPPRCWLIARLIGERTPAPKHDSSSPTRRSNVSEHPPSEASFTACGRRS